jgi:hypothetical protein
MRWITRLDEACGRPEPCAWIVSLEDETAQRDAAAPCAADLAHAAATRAADGGAARLWRRRLLRALAARRLGAHPDEIVFAPGEPRPARLLSPAPLFLSGASRGPWTVVAVGPEPLGVDIELTGGDIEALGGPPEDALRRWTAAEAYVKASGCSLDEAWSLAAEGFADCAISHRLLDGIAMFAAAEPRSSPAGEASTPPGSPARGLGPALPCGSPGRLP